MPPKKVTLPKNLTLDERYILQAADLLLVEAKFLYRFHHKVKILQHGIRLSVGRIRKDLNRAMPESSTGPVDLIEQLRRYVNTFEDRIKKALAIYADAHIPTRWMRAVGVGTAQAVGLYTLIDIERCHKPSTLWRYCGYDPSQRRLTQKEARTCLIYFRKKFNTRRASREVTYAIADELNRNREHFAGIAFPANVKKLDASWNHIFKAMQASPGEQNLKEILYRVGLFFKRGHGKHKSAYFSIYSRRREYELERNGEGLYADQAALALTRFNFKPTSRAFKEYSAGRLPRMHIDARARRFAVKIFLVHLHQVLFYERYGEMPDKPYVLSILKKDHEISCPMWPFSSR